MKGADGSAAASSRPGLALFVLSATQSLVVIDGIPVAIALPAIGRDLDLSPGDLQWVVNAYTLAVAGGLMLASRSADLFGRRRLLMIGLSVLTTATLVAGLAPTGPLLVVARAGQGLGAAMALPASLALVPTLFPGAARRDRAFATMAIINSVAWIAGALLAGVITGLLGWRYVFLVAVPFTLLALMLARRVLPESRDQHAPRHLDFVGAVSITAGLIAIVYGIVQVKQGGVLNLAVLAPIGTGLALLGAFAFVERRAAAPLIQPELFRVSRLWGASVGVAANTAAYSAAIFIGTLYLQDVRGLRPVAAGLAFVPLALGALAGPILLRVLSRVGAPSLAVGGLLVNAAVLASFAWLAHAANPHLAALVPAMLVFGVAQYGTWLALVGQATSDVDSGQFGVASGVFKTCTHLGGAVAVAVFAATIETVSDDGPPDGGPYQAAYLAGAALTVLGALAVGLLFRRAASQARRAAMPV